MMFKKEMIVSGLEADELTRVIESVFREYGVRKFDRRSTTEDMVHSTSWFLPALLSWPDKGYFWVVGRVSWRVCVKNDDEVILGLNVPPWGAAIGTLGIFLGFFYLMVQGAIIVDHVFSLLIPPLTVGPILLGAAIWAGSKITGEVRQAITLAGGKVQS